MPRVIENPLIIGTTQCGVFLSYDEVEEELAIVTDTPKLTRVLPAPFFYEKRLYFYLIRRIEPGGKAGFPNGGYEVRDESGAMRSFDLNQVIVHPQVIKHRKTLDKMARRAEKEKVKRERERKRIERGAKPKNKSITGKRGRPALSPEAKAAREAEVIARATRSGGKRGRPKSTEVKVTVASKPTGGRKGRPSLTPEALAARASAKAATRARSGGKRGRPKKIVVNDD